jgi:hypothetical protein
MEDTFHQNTATTVTRKMVLLWIKHVHVSYGRTKWFEQDSYNTWRHFLYFRGNPLLPPARLGSKSLIPRMLKEMIPVSWPILSIWVMTRGILFQG